MTLQEETTEIWDIYYRGYESGPMVGIEYPTEPLIRFVSNLRKQNVTAAGYFQDQGSERSIKTGFSGKALELGFGSVANLRMCARKGFEPIGLEVSHEAVKRGREFLSNLGEDAIKLDSWEPIALPFPDEEFQLIYGLQCIYYNLELEKLIAEFYRTLKPGGNFMFSFFSTNHGYMEMLEQVESNIYRWSQDHANSRLPGAYFRQPQSREELADWFAAFDNVRVFVTETDQLPVYQSWWYVTGTKPAQVKADDRPD